MNENVEENLNLLTVWYSNSKGRYFISLGKGSSVAETAFCMTVVIRCLLRDGYIKDKSEILNLIETYLNDSQYDEIKNEE